MEPYPTLVVRPVTLRVAAAFVTKHHRHHAAPRIWRFGVGLECDGVLVAVGLAGTPVARLLNDGYTLEVLRCCTLGHRNAASMVYGALANAAKALGYRRIVTYTRADEGGISLKAAGWKAVGVTAARSWHRDARPRTDKTELVARTRWERTLAPPGPVAQPTLF